MGDRKIKHLEMIQAIINRMANNSFAIKGWSVTLVAALFALAAKDTVMVFVYLAYFPAIAFWILDGYFLGEERRFRKLYDYVRTLDESGIDFSMNRDQISSWSDSWPMAIFSKTLIIFHGIIVISVVIVMLLMAQGA